MTFKLPPTDRDAGWHRQYTADQVRAAYEQGLEDAAKVCESRAVTHRQLSMFEEDKRCAAEIRNLKETTK